MSPNNPPERSRSAAQVDDVGVETRQTLEEAKSLMRSTGGELGFDGKAAGLQDFQPFPVELVHRIQGLVDGVDVDLDKPLPPEDE